MTRFLLPLLLLLLLAASGHAASTLYPPQWLKLTTQELYDKGVAFVQDSRPDSALVCYTLAAARYRVDLGREEKIVCANSFIGQWDVNFLYYFDYEKSYESLMRAKEIYDDLGMTNPRIFMELGGLYEVMAEQTQTAALNGKAIDYYQQAFDASVRMRDVATLNFSLLNAVMLAYRTGSHAATTRLLTAYEQQPWVPQDSMWQFCRQLCQTANLVVSGKYNEALIFARQCLSLLSMPNKSHARLLFNVYYIIADVYARQNDYAQARQVMLKALDLQKQYDIRDNVLIALRLVSDYCRKLGNHADAANYHQELLELKDSLLSFRQLNNLNGLEYNYQLTRLNEQISMAASAHRRQNIIIVITTVAALIIGLFLVLFLLKNRRLRQANVHLYQKNSELMRLERERAAAQESTTSLPAITLAQDENGSEAIAAEADVATDGSESMADGDPKPKYGGNHLDEEFKRKLFKTIEAYMNRSTDIFDSGFGLLQLAAAVNSNSSYVSQVINECTASNFSAYLNRFRIREACKRIDNTDQYGNMTLEAISDSVGFKSRTTFRRSFKLITGLNPSEYLRIARDKNTMNNNIID
ncbi:MAG: AraC family transcriptional regulator [Muribaculaceae bacterium]|nr:AraC family transcriptional regulator [Muribaculaceae bacterium]